MTIDRQKNAAGKRRDDNTYMIISCFANSVKENIPNYYFKLTDKWGVGFADAPQELRNEHTRNFARER